MIYDARQIANWFLDRAEKDEKQLSIGRLLKLTYIAHGWHLEIYDSPLFSNHVEAWPSSAVIPDVYESFRSSLWNIFVKEKNYITKRAKISPVEMKDEDEELLEQVWDFYKELSYAQLYKLICIPSGPWHLARQMQVGRRYPKIPDELTKQHYVLKRIEVEKENKSKDVENNTSIKIEDMVSAENGSDQNSEFEPS